MYRYIELLPECLQMNDVAYTSIGNFTPVPSADGVGLVLKC